MNYPYYLFFGEDKLKAMNKPEVKEEADHIIATFVKIIEKEKA